MATIEELQQQVAALSAQVAAITTPPTDYYTSQYSGEEIDQGVGRALPGGGIDVALERALPGGEIDQLRPNRNLLDNWDFRNPVNQRGQTSYTGVRYMIDRWRTWANGTLNIVDGGITVSDSLFQYFDGHKISDAAIPITITIKMENGNIYHASGMSNVGFYASVNEVGFEAIEWQAYPTGNDTFKIVSVGGGVTSAIIESIKLELGAVSTLANDPPADYGIELLKCQRYFQTFKTQPLRPTDYRDFRPIMRTNPVLSTITVGADTLYTASADL